MAKKLNLAALSFLVVGNNAQERQAAKTILHTLGARNIRLVQDGSEAITEMKRFPADVVLCEWDMSPVNGLQFTQRIRAEGKGIGQFAAIIALCGELSQQLVVEARDVGVNDFIATPMSIGSVTSRLHRVFDNPRDFVRSDTYFGPDRRCRDAAFEGDERRQTTAKRLTHPLASKFASVIPGKPKPKAAKAPQPRPTQPPPAMAAPMPAAPVAPQPRPTQPPPAMAAPMPAAPVAPQPRPTQPPPAAAAPMPAAPVAPQPRPAQPPPAMAAPMPTAPVAPQPRPAQPPPAMAAPMPTAPVALQPRPEGSPPTAAAVRDDIHPAMSQDHLLAALGASGDPSDRPVEGRRDLPPAMTQNHLLATLRPPDPAIDSETRPVAETRGDRPAAITQDDLMAAFRALLSSSLHQDMP
ncbi:MAG TPA: response regulator [Rhodospirillaceae bacterium]|jgi:CheY-like chemotaxis protein|nr:response regulator [Rhodospirillaceae bacterium]